MLPLATLGDWLETAPGPSFLWAYFLWFLFCWITLLVMRYSGNDTPVSTATMLLLYEGLGVARYMAGSSAGMQRWIYLILMMIVGALFFIIRFSSNRDNSSGSSCSSCSAGGGCGGGGGGGGGGCGGCGGD